MGQQGFGNFQVLHQLRQQRLDLQVVAAAQGFHHQAGNAGDELTLGDILGNHLMAGVDILPGGCRHIVALVAVAVHKHPFPGYQHIVKENDGVHFLKAGTQGMVKVRLAQVKAFPADKLQSVNTAGDGESKGVLMGILIPRQQVGAGRIDHNFIGKGAESSQDAGAAHDETSIGFLDYPQSNIGSVVH